MIFWIPFVYKAHAQERIGLITELPCQFYFDSVMNRKVYLTVDRLPEVKGGQEKIYKEMQNRLRYPSDLGNMDSIIVAQFVVEVNGKVTGKKIIKDIEATNLGTQILSLIDNLKWYPGTCNGNAVPMQFQLPFRILIQ